MSSSGLIENTEPVTVTAGATVRQYDAVTLQSDGKADPSNAATDVIAGIAQEAGVDTDAIPIVGNSGAKVVCRSGAAVALGAAVMAGTSGAVITHTGTNPRFGIALTAAGAADESIQILVD